MVNLDFIKWLTNLPLAWRWSWSISCSINYCEHIWTFCYLVILNNWELLSFLAQILHWQASCLHLTTSNDFVDLSILCSKFWRIASEERWCKWKLFLWNIYLSYHNINVSLSSIQANSVMATLGHALEGCTWVFSNFGVCNLKLTIITLNIFRDVAIIFFNHS